MRARDGEDASDAFLQRRPHLGRGAAPRLHAQESRDGLQAVLHAMVRLAQHRRLHAQLALLLAQLRHIFCKADAPPLAAAVRERHIAHEKYAAARLDLLFQRLVRAHALARDLRVEAAVEELHADEVADAEHVVEVERRRIGKDDAAEAVGDEDRRAGRERAKELFRARLLRLLHDVLRCFREMPERRLRQPLAVEHERDDSEGARSVRDREGEHLKALAEADLALAALQAALCQRGGDERLLGARDRLSRARERRRLRKRRRMRQEARGDEEAPHLLRGQIERQLCAEKVSCEGERRTHAPEKLRLHRRQGRALARQRRERACRCGARHARPTSLSDSPGTALSERSEKPPASA